MYITRIGIFSLVLAGIVTVVVLLAGCGPQTPSLPLSLCAQPDIAHQDDEIIVSLENPTGTELFIPVAWTGLAIYRMLVSETWTEYLYPQGSPAMHTTSQNMIQYSIPAGTLEPGGYKLTLQGRTGLEGTPFSLEVNFTVVDLH